MLTLLFILASFSLFFFPYGFSNIIIKLFSYIASFRFRILTKTRGKIFMRLPFTVLGHKCIKVGENFVADSGFRIECWEEYQNRRFSPIISIGNNVSFNYRCHIGAINRIIIGNNVLVGSQVLITDHFHGNWEKEFDIPPKERELYSKGEVVIEDNVWIGEGVCILPNVHIGKNSVIGANSVVLNDIPANCVAAGNPAKVIKIINLKLL